MPGLPSRRNWSWPRPPRPERRRLLHNLDSFFNGSATANPKVFAGVDQPLGAQTIAAEANGGALALVLMDQLMDMEKPGRPEALLLSKRTRRKLSALRRASKNLLETDVDAFGRRGLFYDGIPLAAGEFVSDAQAKGTSGNVCSSVYAVRFGQGVGVMMGLEHGGIQVETIGELEGKDATRHRIKW